MYTRSRQRTLSGFFYLVQRLATFVWTYNVEFMVLLLPILYFISCPNCIRRPQHTCSSPQFVRLFLETTDTPQLNTTFKAWTEIKCSLNGRALFHWWPIMATGLPPECCTQQLHQNKVNLSYDLKIVNSDLYIAVLGVFFRYRIVNNLRKSWFDVEKIMQSADLIDYPVHKVEVVVWLSQFPTPHISQAV